MIRLRVFVLSMDIGLDNLEMEITLQLSVHLDTVNTAAGTVLTNPVMRSTLFVNYPSNKISSVLETELASSVAIASQITHSHLLLYIVSHQKHAPCYIHSFLFL